MLSLGLVTFIADWQALSETADRVRLTVIYEVTAITAMLVFITAVCLALAVHLHVRNRRRPQVEHIPTIPIVLDFLAGGFPGYRSALATSEERVDARRTSREDSIPELMQSLNALLVAQQAYDRDGGRRRTPAPPVLIDQVFSGITTALLAQLSQGRGRNLNTNYMRAVSFTDATPKQLDAVQFTKPTYATCSHILVLERYTTGRFTPPFALAVHKNARERLPGAPAAFGEGKPQAMLTRRPTFPKDTMIHRATQNRVRDYLARQSFRSFLCVAMLRGTEIVGVVNVESDDEVFDPRDERVLRLGESLHPYCSILASLL